MSEISVSKKHVTVPFASVMAAASAIFAAGVTWAVTKGDIAQVREANERLERETDKRSTKQEAKTEQLEASVQRLLITSERTLVLSEQTQKDIAELKSRLYRPAPASVSSYANSP